MTNPSTSGTQSLKVFLCHASDDKPSVRFLHRRLQQDGFNPWLDEIDLMPGQDWDLEIRQAVRSSDAIIVCLTKRSITKEGYIQKELRLALDIADEKPEGTIFLIPVRLESCDVPDRLSKWQYVDLFAQLGYSSLLQSLRQRGATLQRLQPRPRKGFRSTILLIMGVISIGVIVWLALSRPVRQQPERGHSPEAISTLSVPERTSEVPNAAVVEQAQLYRIEGLQNVKVYPDDSPCYRDNSGCNYIFSSGRQFTIASFYRQVEDVFKSTDESGQEQDLEYDFKGIWKRSPPLDPAAIGAQPMYDRQGSPVIFGQYDFSGNRPDSLVIISAREEDGFSHCGVNVYILQNNNWNLTGILKATDVLGACDFQFKVNKITIPRHLRGFYHQITFQSGRFEDTSDF